MLRVMREDLLIDYVSILRLLIFIYTHINKLFYYYIYIYIYISVESSHFLKTPHM